MAAPSPSRPRRALIALGLILAALFAAIGANVAWAEPQGRWAPKLGLDLEGGTSITLIPRPQAGREVTDESITQAVEILRKRVDSFGVAEAEVARQGTGASQTILITVPGRQGSDILDLVGQTAELRFRKVLASLPAGSIGPAPQPEAPAAPVPADPAATTKSPKPSGSAKPSAGPSPSASAKATVAPAPSTTTQGRVLPQALLAPAPSPTPSSAPSGSGSSQPGSGDASPAPAVTGGSSAREPGEDPAAGPAGADPFAGIPPEMQQAFLTLDCSKPAEIRKGIKDEPGQALATCDRDGTEKFLLGPAQLQGTDVSEAAANPGTNSQGQVIPGQWQVNLDFTGEGRKKWADFTTANVQERVAVVLDGLVVSAPSINEPITGGQTQISGSFTQREASDLANVLKYGSLPLTFEPGTAQEISPQLGSEQLRGGLLAGALGLLLVVVYCLLYYRGLGVVNIASLVVSAAFTYGSVVLLSNMINLRLSLAGVAGLIIGIGIAADSFIVYFERLRDEVRDGRTLRVAVETGWRRARRTILAADFVSFLAAIVLYALSVGAVKGFAVTLGLATVIDILVVFLFTKPVVTLLARKKFFADGHPLSGLDRRRLGAKEQPPVSSPSRRRRAVPVATRTAAQEA